MSQFQELCDLAKTNKDIEKHFCIIYGRPNNFPLEIRRSCAKWIEDQDWSAMQHEGMNQCERYGEMMYNGLLAQIAEVEKSTFPFLQKMQLQQSREMLKENFGGNYGEFLDVIQRCLSSEALLIDSLKYKDNDERRQQADPVAQESPAFNSRIVEFRTNLRKLCVDARSIDEEQERMLVILRCNEDKIKQADVQLEACPEGTSATELRQEKNKLLKIRTECSRKLASERQRLGDRHIDLALKLAEIMKDVWKQITDWKTDMEQACTTLTKPKQGIVDILDKMCDDAGDLLVKLVQQLDSLISIYQKLTFAADETLEKLKTATKQLVTDYLETHLKNCFVVERNIPNQVLKVTTGKSLGFSMGVRFLGGKALSLSMTRPKVTVELYHEKDIDEVLKSSERVDGQCRILNGKDKEFEFQQSGRCTAPFNNMVVERVKRVEKGRNDEFVTEHKHAFIFFATVKLMEKEHKLTALSLPIVVTSQTSQECMARGTLIWSAAFPKKENEKKTRFEAEETVPWKDFAEVINSLFLRVTGRGLTKENINYLAKVAFREVNDLDFSKMMITRQLIMKDKLRRDFQFWKWLWSCFNLIKDRVSSEWKEGLIHGFISKEEAERKLLNQPAGTFLIRFSETNIEQSQRADIYGYVAVAVKEIHPRKMLPKVFHIKESLTPKELLEKGLAVILDAYEVEDAGKMADRRHMKKLLKNLWFNEQCVPFENVFEKYLTDPDLKRDENYRFGKYRIEIFLTDNIPRTRQNSTSCPMAAPQSPMMSSMGAPSPMMSSVGAPSPGPASPAQSESMYSEVSSPGFLQEEIILTAPAQLPVAMVTPMGRSGRISSAQLANQLGSMQVTNHTDTRAQAFSPPINLSLHQPDQAFSPTTVTIAPLSTEPNVLVEPAYAGLYGGLGMDPSDPELLQVTVDDINAILHETADGDIMLADPDETQ